MRQQVVTCKKVSLRCRDRRADSRLESIRRARRLSSAVRLGSICESKRLGIRLRGLAPVPSASLPVTDAEPDGGADLPSHEM